MQQNRSPLTGKMDGCFSGVVVLFQNGIWFQNSSTLETNEMQLSKWKIRYVPSPKVEGDVQTPSKEVELPGCGESILNKTTGATDGDMMQRNMSVQDMEFIARPCCRRILFWHSG